MKLPLIDDPHGPFAMDVGTKASPSRMKYAGGSCVVITDDDIGDGPGTRRLPSYVASAAVRSTSMRWPGKPNCATPRSVLALENAGPSAESLSAVHTELNSC